jgi:hypothetical protein
MRPAASGISHSLPPATRHALRTRPPTRQIRTGDEVRMRYRNSTRRHRRLLQDAPPSEEDLEGFDIITASSPKEVYTGGAAPRAHIHAALRVLSYSSTQPKQSAPAAWLRSSYFIDCRVPPVPPPARHARGRTDHGVHHQHVRLAGVHDTRRASHSPGRLPARCTMHSRTSGDARAQPAVRSAWTACPSAVASISFQLKAEPHATCFPARSAWRACSLSARTTSRTTTPPAPTARPPSSPKTPLSSPST